MNPSQLHLAQVQQSMDNIPLGCMAPSGYSFALASNGGQFVAPSGFGGAHGTLPSLSGQNCLPRMPGNLMGVSSLESFGIPNTLPTPFNNNASHPGGSHTPWYTNGNATELNGHQGQHSSLFAMANGWGSEMRAEPRREFMPSSSDEVHVRQNHAAGGMGSMMATFQANEAVGHASAQDDHARKVEAFQTFRAEQMLRIQRENGTLDKSAVHKMAMEAWSMSPLNPNKGSSTMKNGHSSSTVGKKQTATQQTENLNGSQVKKSMKKAVSQHLYKAVDRYVHLRQRSSLYVSCELCFSRALICRHALM
jgi:hypothetical protein